MPLAAVLEGDAADDQADQDHQQRQVEAGEHRGVPLRERGEGGAARGEQPHLVAVPDRPDGVDQYPAALLVLADQAQQRTDAEVETLQDQVAGPQDRDEKEPEIVQAHGGYSLHCWALVIRPASSLSRVDIS